MTEGDAVPLRCTPGPFSMRRSHRFEGRYDRSEPAIPKQVNASIYGSTSISATGDAAVRRVTYVRDVCVRCGLTIERVKS